MRQALIPFGGHEYAKREDFPSSGLTGHLYLADDERKLYVFLDGEYKAYGDGDPSGGVHNDLEGINGGDRDAEDNVTFAAHLTRKQLDDVNGIRNPAPFKPINISPSAGETDIMPIFAFQSSAYLNSQGSPMINLRIQIATDEAFTQMVIDETQEGDGVTFNLDTDNLGQYRLLPNTTYYWRVMHQAENNYWSEWSTPTSFQTAETFPDAIGYTPRLILPLQDGEVDLAAITLVSSPAQAAGGAVTHESSDWRIGLTPEGALAGNVWASNGDTVNLGSILVGDDLDAQPANVFHAVVRHHMKTVSDGSAVDSPFSLPRRFRRKSTYTGQIIGIKIVLDKNNNNAPSYTRIDGEGNPVSLGSKYFDNHPTFATPTELALIEGQHMGIFSKFWVATESYEDDDYKTIIYKIAPFEFANSIPHPAFRLSDTFALAKYFNSDGTVGESQPGKIIYINHSNSASKLSMLAEARNGAGDTSWHTTTIYERSVLRLLMLIEAGTMDNTIWVRSAGLGWDPGATVSGVTNELMTDDATAPYWRGFNGIVTWFSQYGYSGQETRGVNNTGGSGITTWRMAHPDLPLAGVSDTKIPAPLSSNNTYVKNIAIGFNDVLGIPVELMFIYQDYGNANTEFKWQVHTTGAAYGACSCAGDLAISGGVLNSGKTFSRITKWL